MKCTYEYNGQVYTKENLDNELITSKLSNITNLFDVVFEKTRLQEKADKLALEIEKNIKEFGGKSPQTKLIAEKFLLNLANAEEVDFSTEKYTGANTFIHSNILQDNFDVENFKSNRRIQLNVAMSSPSEHRKDYDKLRLTGLPRALAIEAVIQDEVDSWDYIRKTGTILDDIFGIVFDKDGMSNTFITPDGKLDIGRYLEERGNFDNKFYDKETYNLSGLYSIGPRGNYVSPLLDKFVNQAIKFKESLNLEEGDRVLNQAVLKDDTLKVRGIADLIIVRKNGKVELYDYKASAKLANEMGPSSEWDINKQKSVKYQLEFYSRMLLNYGIHSRNISKFIVPIYLSDVSKSTVKDIEVGERFNANLDTGNPMDNEIANTMSKILPVKVDLVIDSTGIKTEIEENIQAFFPTNTMNSELSVLPDNYFLNSKAISKNIAGKWLFKKWVDGRNEIMEFETQEAALDSYKAIFKDNIEKNSQLYNYIRNTLDEKLQAFNDLSVGFSFNDGLFNNVSDNVQLQFRKYFSESGWRLANFKDESFQSMLDSYQAIVLINDSDPENPKADIVTLTNVELNYKINFKFGDNILGNVKKEPGNRMTSTLANIMTMRNGIIANAISSRLPNLKFEDSVVACLRPMDGRNPSLIFSKSFNYLIENFSKLCVVTNKTNTLQNSVLNGDARLKSLVNQVLNVDRSNYGGTNVKSNIKNVFLKANELLYGDVAPNAKYEWLLKVQEAYKLLVQQYNNKDLASIITSDSYESYLLKRFASILAEESGAYLDNASFDLLQKSGLLDEGINYGLSFKNKSLGNGYMLKSLDNTPMLQPIADLIFKINQQERRSYTRYKNNKNYKMFQQSSSVGNSVWQILDHKFFYDDSENGKKLFLFKNPEVAPMSALQKEFLTWFLDELNFWRNGGVNLTEQQKVDWKASGKYFEVPLKRASLNSKIVNKKGLDFKYLYQRIVEEVKNPRGLIDKIAEYNELTDEGELDFRNITEMYNNFAISETARQNLLSETENPMGDYETNLQVILDEFALAISLRNNYNEILPSISAALFTLQVDSYISGKNSEHEIEFLTDVIKKTIFDESLIASNVVTLTIAALKRVMNMSVLGFNTMSGAKELTVGYYTAFSRAIANNKNPNKPSLAEFQKAYATVWGDVAQQPFKITLLEKIDNLYGFSQVDREQMAERLNYYKGDFMRLNSMGFLPQRGPDFLHRVTVLLSYMYKYKMVDAYTTDELGDLKYDWKKDGRFDRLATNNKSDMTIYREQEALYKTIMENLVAQGFKIYDPETRTSRFLKWDGNFNNSENDALLEGFTYQLIESIRQEANMLFGYLDGSVKPHLLTKSMFGLFSSFKTILPTLYMRWFLKPDIQKLGALKLETDENGNTLYTYPKSDLSGQFTSTESYLVIDGKMYYGEPAYKWEGEITEGIFWSIVDCIKVWDAAKRREAWNDPIKRRNAILGLGDLLTAFFFGWLFPYLLFGGLSQLRNEENIIIRDLSLVLMNSGAEINPWNIKQMISWDFTSLDWADTLVGSMVMLLTNSNMSTEEFLSRFGIFSPIKREFKKSGQERLKNQNN